MPERKNSEARIRANNKYAAKAYDRINIAVPKGRKAELQAHAEKRGESLNGFIGRAIEEQVKRDTGLSSTGLDLHRHPAFHLKHWKQPGRPQA